MTTYAAAIIYLCASGWCINVLGTVDAADADTCARSIVPLMVDGFPACFVPVNGNQAVILPPLVGLSTGGATTTPYIAR